MQPAKVKPAKGEGRQDSDSTAAPLEDAPGALPTISDSSKPQGCSGCSGCFRLFRLFRPFRPFRPFIGR